MAEQSTCVLDAESNAGTAHLPLGAALKPYIPLWPMILGLTFARSGIIVGSYGSYTSTDAGFSTDGATIASVAIWLVALVIMVLLKTHYSKHQVNCAMIANVVLQAFVLVGLTCAEFGPFLSPQVTFALHTANELLGVFCMAFWLRSARGCSTTTAVVFLFSTFALSEVLIGICSAPLPPSADNALAVVFTLLQLPLIFQARRHVRPHEIVSPTQKNDYLGFMDSLTINTRFFIVTGVGIGLMSVVIGFLRGYPDGSAIAFTPITRMLYAVITIIICCYAIVAVLHGKTELMTIGIWIVMQAFACLALFFYALFPDALEYGAVFATSLNAIMVIFSWYVIIAFMSAGWRDPYYYALGGFAVFLLPRALMRMALSQISAFGVNQTLLLAIMAGFLVLSAQFIYLELVRVTREVYSLNIPEQQSEDHRPSASAKQPSLMTKFMGLDEAPDTYSELRQVAMKKNAQEMGRQFLLSDREIEVVTLYALGYTQQRVAEELYISPGTVHAHIKRIYSKTGLHSRQAILDYLKQYAD